MNFLNQFRIKTKLFFLVVILVIGIIIIGGFGYFYIQKSALALDDVYLNHMTIIENLADLRTQTRANYANILNLCVTDNSADRTKIVDDYNTRVKNITTDLDTVSKLELTSTDNTSLTTIQTKLDTWTNIANQITTQINANDTQGAISTFKDSGQSAFDDLQNNIRDLGKGQMDTAKSVYLQNNKSNQNAEFTLILIIIIATVIAAFCGFMISVSISVPIKQLVQLIRTTSTLNLVYDNSFEHMTHYKDEIGDITRAVGDMRQALRETSTNLHNVSEKLAANSQELASQAEENEKAIQQNATSISEIAQGNTSQAMEITKATEAISDIAMHVSTINLASEASAENVKNSIHIIQEGQSAVKITVDKIEDNIRVSNEVNNSIQELSEQMNKVGDIVTVIREISSRTNLLALNASIEAARAGEAGKGFAVVASEIGALAQNTNSSVDDIAAIIQGAIIKNSMTSDKVDEVRHIVSEQESSIRVMEDSFAKIRETINDIAEQSMDISHKISDVTKTADSISNRMSDMSAIAEQTAAGSEQISASSEEQLAAVEFLTSITGNLATMAENLNQEISKFKM